MVWLDYVSKSISRPRFTDTHIAVFSLRPNEALDLPNEVCIFILFYLTLPVTPPSRDQHLLGICCHRSV